MQRQRAIYSEALIVRETGEVDAETTLSGPTSENEICSTKQVRPISASGILPKKQAEGNVLSERNGTQFANVDPKVCESHKTRPGRPPRRVRVERLRRLYEALDVGELLKSHGIHYDEPGFDTDSQLPLEPFDDTEFDVRTPEEWMELCTDESGVLKPLAARALDFDELFVGRWRKAFVHRYDPMIQQFEVQWNDGTIEMERQMLPRLRIIFAAEDPAVFAERVAAAHASRRMAEVLIKYNFFIDNMPTDGVPQLNKDQAERLLDAAQLSRSRKGEETVDVDMESVLQEVQLDFARTMNRITFDIFLVESSSSDPMHFGLKPAANQGPVASLLYGRNQCQSTTPMQALVPIPPHPFAETFASLCFATLRVRPEVVLALHGVKEACDRAAMQERVFASSFRKALRLDEFRQLQRATAAHASFQLREVWSASLHSTIAKEFGHVGKGWFNIHETSYDLYKRGKMRRFLTLVRMIMQSTIREIAENSVYEFVGMIDRMTPTGINVQSLSSVQCEYSLESKAELALSPGVVLGADRKAAYTAPIFATEVVRRDIAQEGSSGHAFGQRSCICLSVEPHRFVTAVVEAFDGGLSSLNEMQSIERLVLPQLSRSQQAGANQLTGIGPEEPWVVKAKQLLHDRLVAGIPGVESYLRLMRRYDALMSRDSAIFVAAFMRRREQGPPSDTEVQEAIEAELLSEREVQLELPETCHVGLFQIGVKDVRRQLAAKHEQVAQLLLEALMGRLRSQVEETLDGFTQLSLQLRRTPHTVEELVEMRHFVEGAPRQVATLRERISKDVRLYDCLEYFHYKMGVDDIRKRWLLAGAPKAMMDLIASTLRSLQRDEAEFLRQVLSGQEDFEGTLSDIDNTIELFREQPEYRTIDNIANIMSLVEDVEIRLQDAGQQAKLFHSREALLNRPSSDYSQLQRSVQLFETYGTFWRVVDGWLRHRDPWRYGPLQAVEPHDLEDEVLGGVRKMENVRQALRNPTLGVVSVPDMVLLNIANRVYREMEEFTPLVPLVVALRTEGMNKQHWDCISSLVGRPVFPDMDGFNLEVLCSDAYMLQERMVEVQEIADRASKEFSIECRLDQLRSDWQNVVFDCAIHGATGTYVLQGIEPISSMLDEQLIVTQILQFSPFKDNLSAEIDAWAAKLRYMSDNLDEWRKCQTMWLYLQPVFDSVDVTRQLPAESRRFKAVDSLWRSIMKAAHENPQALACLSREGLLDRWVDANQGLEGVQRSLEDFLETKRSKFARFYFLSNTELLEIVSKSKNPARVQPFLGQVFEGMRRLTFREDMRAVSMTSNEGEIISFAQNGVATRDVNVEVWMRAVEFSMSAAMQHILSQAVADYSVKKRVDWMVDHPAQIVITGSKVHWTWQVELALSSSIESRSDPKKQLRILLERCDQQLADMIQLVTRKNQDSGPLTTQDRESSLLKSMVLLDIHHRDVIGNFIGAGVSSLAAFEWVVQIRHQWIGDSGEHQARPVDSVGEALTPGLWIQCVQSATPYGYEYLGGVVQQLVITPLTERVYTTLLNALHLNLAGAVVGTNSAGKSETIAHLAHMVARRFVVFACSNCESVDIGMISRYEKGVASSGAWCLYESMNRLGIEVLSALTHHLSMLLSAKNELTHWSATTEIDFEGSGLTVGTLFGFFATFGSSATMDELPVGLGALFRPVAVVSPHSTFIIETELIALGFRFATPLMQKIVAVYRMAAEHLSQQLHYDFSLRKMRATVALAGSVLRQAVAGSVNVAVLALEEDEDQLGFEEVVEQQAVVRALNDIISSGLVEADQQAFRDIIDDLFPGIERTTNDRSALVQQITKVCEGHRLEPAESFTNKVIQLHSAVHQCHGVAVLGDAGCGKTSCLHTVARAVNRLRANDVVAEPQGPTMNGKSGESTGHHMVNVCTFNPKTVTVPQLYGFLDAQSKEWRDGILTEAARAAARDENGEWHWLVLDGIVDSTWAEGLRSVLDDSRRLCLSSGEVIRFSRQMSVVMEAEDLAVASPALVTRFGIVHLEASMLTTQELVHAWVKRLPARFDAHVHRIKHLCEDLLPNVLNFVRSKDCMEIVRSTDATLCAAFFGLLDCLFAPFAKSQDFAVHAKGALKRKPEKDSAIQGQHELLYHIDHLILFAMTWSVGATCDISSRLRFSNFLRNQAGKHHMEVAAFEFRTGIHERAYNVEGCSWVPWMETSVEQYLGTDTGEPATIPYEDIFIPTVDSVRTSSIMEHFLGGGTAVRHPVCVGPAGVGKSQMVQRFMAIHASGRSDGKLMKASFALSGLSCVSDLKAALETQLDRRQRGVYGPPPGKLCAFFVDDLNMPNPDASGARPALELMRQWFDNGGWHRVQDRMFYKVVDLFMIGAFTASRQNSTPPERLLRHYHCLVIPEPPEASQAAMLSKLVTRCGTLDPSSVIGLTNLIAASMEVLNSMRQELKLTSSRELVRCSLHEAWRIYQGMCSMGLSDSCSKNELTLAWCHEHLRVLGDRLANKKDLEQLCQDLSKRLETHFSFNTSSLALSSLMFSNIALHVGEDNVRVGEYAEVSDKEFFQSRLSYLAEQYAGEYLTMPLVIFSDASQHVARICRFLQLPGGHGLLVGLPGSGRRALARFASFIVESNCHQIQTTGKDSMAGWRLDLKAFVMQAGDLSKKRSQTLLIGEAQIFAEEVLDDVSRLMSCGDIPDLYRADDMETIMKACTAQCNDLNQEVSKINTFQIHLQRVRQFAHFVVCLCPNSRSFRKRLILFPALLKSSTVDWFHAWSEDALIGVARARLGIGLEDPMAESTSASLEIPETATDTAVTVFPKLHHSGISVFRDYSSSSTWSLSPAIYFRLLAFFQDAYNKLRAKTILKFSRYEAGASKIQDAGMYSDVMQQQAREQLPQLEHTKREIEELNNLIQVDRAEVENSKRALQREEQEARDKEQECRVRERQVLRELSDAMPALEDAMEGLRKLQAGHIREIKAMSKPAAGVVLTMTAVCVLLGVPPVRKPGPKPGTRIDDYWEVAQTHVLKEPKKFIDDILAIDRDSITDEVARKIQPFLLTDEFEPAQIKKASVACEAICVWVRALHRYYETKRAVEPKRQQHRKLLATLDEISASCQKARTRMVELQGQVDEREKELEQLTKSREQLTTAIATCELKVKRSRQLMETIGFQREQWFEIAAGIKAHSELILGDCIFCAALVTYGAPLSSRYREFLSQHFLAAFDERGLVHSDSAQLGLRQVIGDQLKIEEWNLCGLPDEPFAIDNAIIMSTCQNWPLIIDPHRQANSFIRGLGKSANSIADHLDVIKYSDTKLLRTLEHAVERGTLVLLELATIDIDSALDPLLEKQFIQLDGGGLGVKIGTKEVPWNSHFRLYMTTRLGNPDLSPDLFSKVTLLNFEASVLAQEKQLLTMFAAKMHPEIEHRRSELDALCLNLQRNYAAVEDALLDMLSSEANDVLSDDTQTDALGSSRKDFEHIASQLENAKREIEELQKTRDVYAPLSGRAVLLFRCVADLARLCPMYQFSWHWFVSLSMSALTKSQVLQEGDDPGFCSTLTLEVFNACSRSLSPDDRIAFGVDVCARIYELEKGDGGSEIQFLTAPTHVNIDAIHVAGKDTSQENQEDDDNLDDPPWLVKARTAASELSVALPGFEDLAASIDDSPDWHDFCVGAEGHRAALPPEWDDGLTRFQRLCIIKALRPDCLDGAFNDLIVDEIGLGSVEKLDLPSVVADQLLDGLMSSNSLTPLLVIHLDGDPDPADNILALARRQNVDRFLKSISLGQGQGPRAERLILEASLSGNWMLLRNCHLMPQWLPELETLLDSLGSEQVGRDFRLWLVAQPSEKFPLSILQNSQKLVISPPNSTRALLIQAYADLAAKEEYEGLVRGTDESYQRTVLGLCFLHVLLCRRRRFGSIGWTTPYTFYVEDLVLSNCQLRGLFEKLGGSASSESNEVFENQHLIFQYLAREVHYAGRVSDAYDMKALQILASRYLNRTIAEGSDVSALEMNEDVTWWQANNLEEKLSALVDALPITFVPEAFGLHPDVISASLARESRQRLENFARLRHRSFESGEESDAILEGSESTKATAKRMQQIRILCNQLDDMSLSTSRETPVTGHQDCFHGLLWREVASYERLLRVMRDHLYRLRDRFRNSLEIPDDLVETIEAIDTRTVPTAWSDVGYLSLKPLASWMDDLSERVRFFWNWQKNDIRPYNFWISAFMSPQSFLSAVLIYHSRKHELPLEDLVHKFEVLDVEDPALEVDPPSDGAFTHGWFLHGCTWSKREKHITHAPANALFNRMPLVWLLPTTGVRNIGKGEGFYDAPAYRVASRIGSFCTSGHHTNFLVEIALPTKEAPSVWVLGGVAIVLSLES